MKKWSRFLSLWMVLTMLLSLFNVGTAAAQPQKQEATSTATVALRLSPQAFKAAPDLAARWVIDYGSFVWVEIPVNRLSLLAEKGISYQAAETTIGVYGYRFDPLQGEPVVPADLAADNAPDKPGLQLVQFSGPTQDAWLDGLQNAGLKVLQYYAHNAYLVWGTPAQLGQASQESFVRWSGAFHPAFKLGLNPSEYAGEIDQVAITFYNDGYLKDTIESLSKLGKVIQYWATQPDEAFYTAILILDAARVGDVVRLPTVWAIEYSSPKPGLDDENANQIVAGNVPGGTPTTGYYTWLTSKGVNGSGVSWADVDTGLNAAHPDVAGRVAACVSTYGGGNACVDTDGHGSHTAGAIMGDGRAGTGITDPSGFYWGTGMAPSSTLVVQNALMGTNWPPTGGWNILSRDSVLNGASGSSNSWYTGSYNNSYTAACREHDLMVRDAVFTSTTTAEPIIYVFSAGNGGPNYSTLSEPHASKNPIIVGASSNYPRSAATINDMAYFSSRGPAADGRTLPTITAPGYQTASLNGSSANCGSTVAGAGSAYYNYCSGTSMACPQVAGASALIVDWWRQDFGQTPSPAMVKALLVNGAEDQNGGNRAAGGAGGTLANIPNNDVGWGRVNLNNVIRTDVPSLYTDQENLFHSTGETWQTTLVVSDPSKPVKCSVAWTDAAGAVGASPALVNNLDLTVQNGGNTYLGNVFTNGWSAIGGSADTLNNIENVFLPAGASGPVLIVVSAANIAGDGVPYNGDSTDQDFALVCYNVFQEGVGWLEGTVYDGSGTPATTPLTGVSIQATGLVPTHTGSTISKEAGFYRLGLLTDTYTLTTALYGYYPAEIGGVSVVSGTTTTLNIPLTMAPWYVVSGTVTDANTGWPLYASIEIAGYPYGAIWNNPVTGWYSVSLPAGFTHTLTARAWVSGYQPGNAQINLSGDATLNIALNANIAACNAPGYSLGVSVLWSNSFEGASGGTFPADGWDQVDTSGTAGNWTAPTSGSSPVASPHSGTRLASFNSYNASSGNSTRLFRTSGVDLSGESSAAVMFWMYHDTGYTTNADRIQVQISTDGGTTWNNVGAAINRYDGSTGWKQHTVDISAYTGGSYTDVRLGLHAISAYGNNMHVDDVQIATLSCMPLPGGLVVGHVYDENTLATKVGAVVSNDSGRSFTAVATPDDPKVDDAFYTLFSPAGSHVFTATFAGYGAEVQNVTVVASDTVKADMYLPAGWIQVAPTSLQAAAEMGISVTVQLTIANAGGAALDFVLREKDRGWAPVLAVGGPDPFGYRYADSDEPDGPAYQWIDITATGTPIAFTAGGTLDDGYGGPFNIGFPFNFYGTDQTQFYAGTNGFLTFGAGSTTLANQCPLPSTTTPNNLIALLWDDLDFRTSGNAYYQQLTPCPYGGWNTCTVVEYANVMHYGGAAGSAGTWEAVFFPNGSLLIQFQNAGTETGSSSTTGIENAAGTAGLAYRSCDVAGSLKNNLTVCYAYPGEEPDCAAPDVLWLSESPITGTLTASTTQMVDVTMDAGIPEITQPGEYYAQIKVKNNTPYGEPVVPITFTVTAPATWGKLEGTVTGLGYCDTDPAPIEGAVINIETSSSTKFTLYTDENGDYQWWMDAAESPITVTVTFTDHETGQTTGVSITAQATTTVNFDLRWLKPCVAAAPNSLSATLSMGDSATFPMTITNGGAVSTTVNLLEVDGGYAPAAIRLASGGPTFRLPARPIAPIEKHWTTRADIIQDGGFEAGTPNPYWDEYSLNFGTPLCDETSCGTGSGTAGAHSGNWWVWFGGNDTGDTAYVTQTIQMNSGSAATLSFWKWVGAAASTGDYMKAYIDGVEIYAADVTTEEPDYEQVTIDISAFADGNPHILRFASQTAGSGNICIDDVTLDVLGAGAVPWLFEEPVSATLAADTGVAYVDVILHAGMVSQPGTYYATLKTISGDPVHSVINMPITMTVIAPPSFGKLAGVVQGLGRCDNVPAPLVNAQILVQTSTGMTASFTTKAGGAYEYWFDATESPITVTVMAAGHVSQTITGVQITGQATTTLNVALRATLPCADVAPDSLDAIVPAGQTRTLQLTLSNAGASALTFEIQEISGTVTVRSSNVAIPPTTGHNTRANLAETGTAAGPAVIGTPSGGAAPEDIGTAWETKAPLPAGRVFNAVVADTNGYIYVIGGTSDAGATTPTNTNYRYNTATNSWDTMAAMPAALDSIDGIEINNKIYIPGDDTTATTYVYDIATNTWSTIATNNGYTARSQYQVVRIGTDLYVLGGIVGSSASTTEVWKLDTTTGTWSAGVPMQKSRTSFSAAAIDGVIYVAGGVLFPGFTPDMTAEKFDGTAWSYIAGVPTGGGAYTRWSYNADAHGADGLWLAAGRRDAGWAVLNHAGYYDPETDTWTDSPTIPTLTQGRVYMEGDVASDGYFYVIGGRDSAGSTIYATNERLYVGYAGQTPDVIWVAESPITGTVGADSNLTVDVTFTAFPTMTAGVYTATLVFKTNDIKINVPVTMTIVNLPTCGFDTSSPNYLGETTVFTNTSVDALMYRWNFGDNSPLSADVNPTHQYAAVGSYTVTLTATNAAGDSVCTGVVDIQEPPCTPAHITNLTSSSPATLGAAIMFTATVSGDTPITYTWDMGGTGTRGGTDANPTFVYDAAGTYTVTLTVTNACGSDQETTVVTVNYQPVSNLDLSITTAGTIYPNTQVVFSAALTPANLTMPYNYVVNYGDGTVITSTASINPLVLNHIYTATGSYTVTVSVWNGDMTVPITDQVVVTVSPFKVYLPIAIKLY